MIDIILRYKYIIVPFVTWFGIQLFKVLYKRVHEGVWDIERILGAGGMPSSHSHPDGACLFLKLQEY